MASGRWAGMAVRPLPRQSTMLLLQEHIGGQEPDARLHGWTKALPLWPKNRENLLQLQARHPQIDQRVSHHLCTWAGEVALAQLGKVESPERGGRTALSVEAQRLPLSQPGRQPGQVTVTAQRVRVKAAGRGGYEQSIAQVKSLCGSGSRANTVELWVKGVEELTRCGASACGWN